MFRKLFSLLLVVAILTSIPALAANEEYAAKVIVSGSTTITVPGNIVYISLYNEGANAVFVQFNVSGTFGSSIEIPSGATWCPPNGCKLNKPARQFKLTSAGATVYYVAQ